jgi:hypothetical protein
MRVCGEVDWSLHYRDTLKAPEIVTLEVEHVRVKLDHVNFGVSELNTVPSFLHSILFIKHIYKGLIITTILSKVIQTLVIVDPQCYIPGLVVLPTVIGDIESIALVSSSHEKESWFGLVLTL